MLEVFEAELQEDGVVVILGADGIQYLLAVLDGYAIQDV